MTERDLAAVVLAGGLGTRMRSDVPLMGKRRDDRANVMSPSCAGPFCVRYCYCVSQAVQQDRKSDAGSVRRAPATDLETFVLDTLKR